MDVVIQKKKKKKAKEKRSRTRSEAKELRTKKGLKFLGSCVKSKCEMAIEAEGEVKIDELVDFVGIGNLKIYKRVGCKASLLNDLFNESN